VQEERLQVVSQDETAVHHGGVRRITSIARSSRVMSDQPLSEPTRAADVRHLGALTMRSTRDGDTHVIALAGELDLAGADLFDGELQRVEATDARQIVLDLRELEFIDSTGIRLIYMADMRSRTDSDRLVIRRGPDRVHRIFVLTDLADRLPFVD
jgi:anti-anti-sigma factor